MIPCSICLSLFDFVRGIRKEYSCSVFPAPFTEKTILSPLYILGSIVNQLTRYLWIYFWALYAFTQINVTVFIPVPYCFDNYNFVIQLETRTLDTFSIILLSQSCFDFSEFLVVAYKFQDCLFYFCEKFHWNFNMNHIDFVDCFGQYGHFNNIIFPIHEHEISFHLIVSHSVSLISVFWCITFTTLVKFFPRYFILSDAIINGVILIPLSDVKVKVTQSCLTLCDPMDYTVHGILQAKYWRGQPFPSPGDLPIPGIEPRSPTLQADSPPPEPQGKPSF